MKLTSFLTSFFIAASVSASSMETPEAHMLFLSADDQPIQGVALSAILSYSVIVFEDCTGFICMPSLPHRVRKSESGGPLGETDENGQLTITEQSWSTSKLSAKDLKVTYFTNGTMDVYCSDDDEQIAGFVELLPQWVDGKLVERDYDCSSLDFHAGDEKTIEFKCKSPLTAAQIQEKIAEIQEAKCQ